MELRLPLEVFPGRQATCRAVFGTWGSFPDDARASHCPFVLTSFTGWSSKRCPGIGFLSRGDWEIGLLRNVEPPTRPRLECRRETGLILRYDRDVGALCGSHQGCQVPFRPPIPNVGLLLRHCSGKGLHLAMTGEPRGFSRVAAGFSSYDGEFRMPLVLAQGSPIFHSSCEGKLGIALE